MLVREIPLAYGFAKNHCFADDNKRTALASIDVFLAINGQEFIAEEADTVATIVGVAKGAVSESELADWIRRNVRTARNRRR